MLRSRTMSKKFEYHGDLAVTPLAEILATIHRYRVPGIVSVTRGKRVMIVGIGNSAYQREPSGCASISAATSSSHTRTA